MRYLISHIAKSEKRNNFLVNNHDYQGKIMIANILTSQ